MDMTVLPNAAATADVDAGAEAPSDGPARAETARARAGITCSVRVMTAFNARDWYSRLTRSLRPPPERQALSCVHWRADGQAEPTGAGPPAVRRPASVRLRCAHPRRTRHAPGDRPGSGTTAARRPRKGRNPVCGVRWGRPCPWSDKR